MGQPFTSEDLKELEEFFDERDPREVLKTWGITICILVVSYFCIKLL